MIFHRNSDKTHILVTLLRSLRYEPFIRFIDVASNWNSKENCQVFPTKILCKLRLICYCYSKLSNLTLLLSKVTCLSPCSWEGLILVLSGLLLYDSWPACLKLRRKLYWGSQRLSFKKKLPESAWWVLSWDLLRATKKGAAIRTSQQQRFALFSVLRSPKAQSYFHIDKSRCVKKNFGLIEILIKNFSRENCDSEFLLKNVGISRISVNSEILEKMATKLGVVLSLVVLVATFVKGKKIRNFYVKLETTLPEWFSVEDGVETWNWQSYITWNQVWNFHFVHFSSFEIPLVVIFDIFKCEFPS